MLKIVAIVIVGLIATVLIYAATKPDTFRIQRSSMINAPPEKVFGLIDDFKNWASWSPWEQKDLAMKKTHSGAPQGKGAVLEWDGNKDVGTGRMEVLESTPASKILVKLDFLKPFEAHNQAEFTLASSAGSTQITWAMYGPQPYMMKVMGLFCSMDKMVGKDFEAGLASLKALAEK
ncbi:MAG: polyketide cyclase [Nitrospira sp. CR1.3]|nr:polyketide cyclase [Nitrospira sp. CR1.3]